MNAEKEPKCCSGKKSAGQTDDNCPLAYFGEMIDHCYDYAMAAKETGKPVVGIMCEYTPRELIMAAGAVPVCLCGGDVAVIAPAEEDLPANLCPLIKSTYGYHVTGENPFLEMADLIVAETTCDGKKKMYELMAEHRPMYVLELPQKPEDEHAFAHWLAEVGKLKAELQRRFDVVITDEALRAAIDVMNTERRLRRELASLMKADPPAMTGRQLLDLKSSISGIPADLRAYEDVLTALGGQEPDPQLASRVRVLLTGVPTVHGAERVVELIEDYGGVIICMETCTGVKPVLEDVAADARDPLRAIAEKYFHLPCTVMTASERRRDSLRQLAGEYRPDCVIELIWQACLTYDVESNRTQRLVEQELGLPYLRIETDYSPSDSARIALRVEALFETVHAGGKIRAAGGA